MKYSVVVSFSIEGFHCWPEAKDVFPEVAFLSDQHRHQFGFRCYAKVSHTDRDEEFILMQRRIKKQLRTNFGGKHILIRSRDTEWSRGLILEYRVGVFGSR